MKCPRCGSEMTIDSHRKYNVQMCYNCGYTEGRTFDGEAPNGTTNFQHMKDLNMNELAAFLSEGVGVDKDKILSWLCDAHKD
ncbi:MAG TPA: hypothetical protein IAC00_02275 [Candidatus Limivicinus faecipullorum]|nr:hypothetical protein [Candidatus Limivicinus faecipullorum]